MAACFWYWDLLESNHQGEYDCLHFPAWFSHCLHWLAGPDNLVNLKRLAQQFQRQENAGAEDADDDDVPDLVEGESFEEAAKQEAAV